jgi:N4-(beta-N-acetylglucosaminyl)-L-asparaginase
MKTIASENGLQATRRAYQLIVQGVDTLQACVEGIALVEDDPNDISVGYGGLPNEDGTVELDAAVMHGPTHQAGAVAALRNIRHPCQVAKLVMELTDHVLLAGEGALRFARALGFKEEDLLTDLSRKIWLHWKQTLSDRHDWLAPRPECVEPEVLQRFRRVTGTVHCAALDSDRNLSCATSTSGLAFKIAGRVGDSPIAGAGLYVDNEIGSCGSTGRGEASLINVSCHAAVELMRSGMPPADAGLEVLRRVERRTVGRLRDPQGRPNFDLQLYLLGKDGRHAGIALWGPKQIAVTDASGSRLEECDTLFVREDIERYG